MGFFSKSYAPGGEHHVRITDAVFKEALNLIANDNEIREHFKKTAAEEGCAKYEAYDFPVSEIFGAFLLSYELQEEKDNVPENLRVGRIQLGRKDIVEYDKFIQRFNDRIETNIREKQQNWDRKGLGGKLFSLAAGAAAKGIAKAATGKSEDVRWFDKNFANYLCGDSECAKEYLHKYANEFGGRDDALLDVAQAIRGFFWMSEFAKYNRNR